VVQPEGRKSSRKKCTSHMRRLQCQSGHSDFGEGGYVYHTERLKCLHKQKRNRIFSLSDSKNYVYRGINLLTTSKGRSACCYTCEHKSLEPRKQGQSLDRVPVLHGDTQCVLIGVGKSRSQTQPWRILSLQYTTL
jgi:hypothetical protein